MEKTVSLPTENFNNLIVVNRGQVTTTSLHVAEVFHKRHDRVIRTIRCILADLTEDSRPIFGEAAYYDDQQKPRPMYVMNRDGFTLLAMSFTGKPALQFKIRYIDAFKAMEKALAQRQSLEWQQARTHGKIARRAETDQIQRFVEYAKSNGSLHANKYYVNLTRMAYSALGLQDSHKPIRDMLTPQQTAVLTLIECAISKTIRAGIETGTLYRDIYQDAKAQVFELARILTPAVRLLAA